jgi:hypothetical protein
MVSVLIFNENRRRSCGLVYVTSSAITGDLYVRFSCLFVLEELLLFKVWQRRSLTYS